MRTCSKNKQTKTTNTKLSLGSLYGNVNINVSDIT